ncbi:MAG TPA: dephospho-CoA kinase [bacterium]|jgi:dephospho-CoA kinase|nr:dephospho-CoA kinase [bacterium]
MKIVGLTGGIASGKSLVVGIFKELGAQVIDADHVAREVVRPGKPAHNEILEAFGPTMLLPDGTLDRGRLGDLIFRDSAARTRLNAITHKYIRSEIQREIARLKAAGGSPMVIVDVPLLLDKASRDAYDFDAVVLVFADPDLQLERLMAREGLSREQAVSRIMAQRPLAEKIPEADWVIDNSGSPEDTRRQAEALWKTLVGNAGTRERGNA